MKLIFNGTELDATTEHEILCKEGSFGFNAVIIDVDGSVETRNNCHEVHHLYSTPFEPSIAFESDFHGTGGCRKIEQVAVVVISDAAKMEEAY